jgi:hypothetical protein
MIKHHIPGKYLNMISVTFNTGGISGDMGRKKDERELVIRKYFPKWAFWLFRNRLFARLLISNETRNRKKSFLERML